MARSILMLITASDTGHISVEVRGPLKDKEGAIEILKAAQELVEQGNFGSNL
jgi:hypothetical protein